MRNPGRVLGIVPVVVLLIITRAALSAEITQSPGLTLDTLRWMAGAWSLKTESGAMSEEIWLTPQEGLMLGAHRDVRPGRKPFFEYLRLEERDGGVYYIASPGGAVPTEFILTAVGGDSAVFLNSAHDYPQRIVYKRIAPDTLYARIEGEINGEMRTSEWYWTPAKAESGEYDVRKRGARRER